jgi:NADPH-ferrihemoprotein reductase
MEIIIALILVAVAAWWFFIRPAPASKPLSATAAKAKDKAGGDALTIIYGSQTGTAEAYAKVVLKEAHRNGITNAALKDVEDYSGFDLEMEKLVVFVVATYGEGEPTDSMKEFYDWLLDDVRQPGDLAGVKYTVFGLGDKSYKHFATPSIKVDERMAALGAERVHGLATGDYSGSMEEEFDEWRAALWPAVGAALGMTLKCDTEELDEPEFVLRFWDEPPAALPFPPAPSTFEPTQKQPVYLTVAKQEQLLSKVVTDGRSTLHITFDMTGVAMSYQAGDHLAVMPRNPAAAVDGYLKALALDAAAAAKVVSLACPSLGRNQLPARVTVREALACYVDLCGPPKKAVLRNLAHYCADAKQKENFLALLRRTPEALAKYHKLAGKLRTTLGFLTKFGAVVPLGHFFELMPRLAPRYFSIASDQLATPSSVGITVAVIDDGVCTPFLQAAATGAKLPVFVRKSTFHLPLREKTRPLIMIGPGTGVAPLIGFLHRRKTWQSKQHALGKLSFFFGCRSAAEDFIHGDFIKQCAEAGNITCLGLAFSRDQAAKVYVQDKMREHGAELVEMIDDGANIYICGDAKRMAKDVERTLAELLVKHKGVTLEEAEERLEKLSTSQRFLKDVWAA